MEPCIRCGYPGPAVFWLRPHPREMKPLQFTGFSRVGHRTHTPSSRKTSNVTPMTELLCALAAAVLATRWLAAAAAAIGIPSILVSGVTALI